MRSFALAALVAATATAHFNLFVPASAFFDDDQEGNGPCGGATLGSFANASDFAVGGQPIAVRIGHPTTTFLFRVTTDANVLTNFTALNRPIQQSGLGTMCIPAVTAPSTLVGQQGYLQVVGDSPDGLLYQCAAVNFVAGTAAANSQCLNNTGVTAAFTTDATLSNLAASAGNSTANSTSATTTATAATTTASSSSTASTSRSAAVGRVESLQGLVSVVLFGGIASVAFVAQLL